MLIETYFLVPIREDKRVGNGKRHKVAKWKKLQDDLYKQFRGQTRGANIHYELGLAEGDYDDMGTRVTDKCRKYIVAMDPERLDEIRDFLKKVADDFKQECIYFNHHGGCVEFISGTLANGKE